MLRIEKLLKLQKVEKLEQQQPKKKKVRKGEQKEVYAQVRRGPNALGENNDIKKTTMRESRVLSSGMMIK